MSVIQSLYLTQQSQDVINNTSKVRILWRSTQKLGDYTLESRTAFYYVSVNNGPETRYEVSYILPPNSTYTIVDTTLTVPHDGEGMCRVWVRAYMSTGTSAGTISQSKTLLLTQIPQPSSISATDADIGSVSSILITQNSSDFTHSVQYLFGGVSGYVLADGSTTDLETKLTATSIPFTLPESFYTQIPNATFRHCTLICRTYLGETQLGTTRSAVFRATANPHLCAPIVSGTVADINSDTVALTGNASNFVRYHSTAKYTISAEARNGASIVRKQINGVDVTEDVLYVDKVDSKSLVFTAWDSRGYQSIWASSLELIEYTELTANARLVRVDPTSGRAQLEISGNFFNQSFGAVQNQLSASYRIAKQGESFTEEFQDLVPEVTENSYRIVAPVEGLDYENAYTAQVIVQDSIVFLGRRASVTRGIPVFDWGESDFRLNVPLRLTESSYGTEYPANPKKGQVFLLYTEESGYVIKVYDGSNWM